MLMVEWLWLDLPHAAHSEKLRDRTEVDFILIQASHDETTC